MKVDDIGTNTLPSIGRVKTEKTKSNDFANQLSTSKEALQMTKKTSESRRNHLDDISNRVRNGYYDQPNVLTQVAESIINSDDIK